MRGAEAAVTVTTAAVEAKITTILQQDRADIIKEARDFAARLADMSALHHPILRDDAKRIGTALLGFAARTEGFGK